MTRGIKHNNHSRLPRLVVVAHTCAVLAMAVLVYAVLPGEGEAVDDVRIVWGLFLVVDFPSSILSGAIFAAVEHAEVGPPFGIVRAVIVLAASFGIIGGVQYYWLAKLLPRYIRRRRTNWALLNNRCRKCGYDLTGNVTGKCPECGETVERSSRYWVDAD